MTHSNNLLNSQLSLRCCSVYLWHNKSSYFAPASNTGIFISFNRAMLQISVSSTHLSSCTLLQILVRSPSAFPSSLRPFFLVSHVELSLQLMRDVQLLVHAWALLRLLVLLLNTTFIFYDLLVQHLLNKIRH